MLLADSVCASCGSSKPFVGEVRICSEDSRMTAFFCARCAPALRVVVLSVQQVVEEMNQLEKQQVR